MAIFCGGVLDHKFFSLLRYSRISMSHFDILIHFISKTFLVTNEMIESDQNLLFTHEIATCQFFIVDTVGKNNKSNRFDLGTKENPGFAYISLIVKNCF